MPWPAFDPLDYLHSSRRTVVYAANGMTCAGNPTAASIGLQILLKGGNAVDAAVAMAAAMPRESYPSSLVTNINRSFIIFPFCGAKIAHKSESRSDIFAPMRENPKIIPNFAVPSGTYINLFHWA